MTTSIVRIEGDVIISEATNYQGFTYDVINNKCEPVGVRTPFKWDTLKEVFPRIVKDASFLDIGANFGFFCFKALECGCSLTVGIEANETYHNSVNTVLKQKNIQNFKWIHGRFPAVRERTDVVMALSLVHHMFSKMSLEEIINSIKECTNKYAIVEWIDRDDNMVKKYKYDQNFPEYNRQNFEKIMNDNFSSVEDVGEGHHATRTIYLLTV